MPRSKTDATNEDVAAREALGGGPEIGPEAGSPPEGATDRLPPAGAESEPAPRAEPTEPVEAVTVDEAAATGPAEPLAGSATPATEPVLQSAAEAPRPDHAGDHAAAHPDEAVEEEDDGWSLPARVLTALVLVLVGVALGIWAAPKIAPVLPSGMKPVADWLTPGASSAEAEIAALRAELDQGLSGVESRFAALPAPEAADQRIAAAVDSARSELSSELSGEIAALKQTVGQIDPTAARQQLDRLDAAVKGQEAELAALKEQLAGATAASGQRSDEAVDNLNVYSAEVEGLRAEMGTLQDKVSALATRIDEVAADADRQIATAQTRVGEIQTRAASALGAAETGAAVALVRAAIASGQPFDNALGQLEGRPGITVPPGLTAAAASGVPTLAQLRDSFPDAAHAAIRASIMASAGEGVLARSRAYLEAQVASRSLTPQPGMTPDAVLSRMEDRLRRDDLEGAIAESAQLPSEAATAMGDWLAAARLRLGAEEGLAALDAATTPPATN